MKINTTKLLIVLIGIVILVVPARFSLSGMGIKQHQADGVRQEAVVARQQAAAIDAFGTQQATYAERIAALDRALPASGASEGVLNQVQLAAQSSGVAIKTVSPASQPDDKGTYTLSLSVAGAPSAVVRFVDALRELPRLITLDTVTITSGSGAEGTSANIGASFYTATAVPK